MENFLTLQQAMGPGGLLRFQLEVQDHQGTGLRELGLQNLIQTPEHWILGILHPLKNTNIVLSKK